MKRSISILWTLALIALVLVYTLLLITGPI